MNPIITRIVMGTLALVTTVRAADFFVATNGRDSNPGTISQPFATLPAARDAARLAGAGSHRITVMPGEYFLAQTLELDARDNGLTIESAAGGMATLYGGQVITGWRRDGDKFWCADLPGVKEGTRDFRALVVNGRLAERSRVPETGTLMHRSKFDVASLPAVAGYWARQPTLQERTSLEYDPKDIPPTFEIRNAEVRVYHSWDESLVGISRQDEPRHMFTLSPPARFPPGAFGVKKYVICNTREGMTKPGQWYLDRVAGRVCYWPLAGEDLKKVRAIAPVLECIISIVGTNKAPAQNITLRGFALQATTTPLKPAGFAAMHYDGALHLQQARQCVVEKLDISNVGGLGILASDLLECQLRDCQIHHIGAGGASVTGARTVVARNHIHHVGLYYPGAAALYCNSLVRTNVAAGLHIFRNEVHDAPYCGIIIGGEHLLVEGNLVYRVMREMQDGAGIYGNAKHSLVRGNVVRDIVKMGEGTGVSAYYLDEGSEDTVVERNVSLGIERPTHNHITTRITLRDNVFNSPTNMILSFQRSSGAIFSNNIVVAPGKISVSPPNAVKVWTNNLVIREGLDQGGAPQPFTIDDAMPPAPAPARRPQPVEAVRVASPPALDGEIGLEEWPGAMLKLDREPSRWPAGGAPAYARIASDDRCLYVAVNVVVFDVTQLQKGSVWGRDDGAEICIAGSSGTFVIRGFAGGSVQSVTDGGATAAAADRLGSAVRFVAKPYGSKRGDWKSGWRGEWSIPFDALGLKPAPGQKVGFNIGVYRAQDERRLCLEGALAENWRLDQAATLQFK
ncbi:MAG: right-handed parallel beta-helix repeat-containing protein [Verrucomicrobiota bacterium]